jgi:hypothetical protein
LFFGNKDGTLTASPLAANGPGGVIAFGDVDGDGNTDVVGGPSWQVAIAYGDGKGNFTMQQYPGVLNGANTVLIDVNADGRLDIVGASGGGNYQDASMGVSLNKGNRRFDISSRYKSFFQYNPDTWAKIYPVDMNSDGVTDLIMPADDNGSGIRVFYIGCGK